MKKIILLMTLLCFVFSLSACGTVSEETIQGSWRLKTVSEQSIEEYANAQGVTKDLAMVTFKIEDEHFISTAVDPEDETKTVTSSFPIERTETGFEVMLEDTNEVIFTVRYDEENDTLSYGFDLGAGEVTYVFERGTYEFSLN